MSTTASSVVSAASTSSLDFSSNLSGSNVTQTQSQTGSVSKTYQFKLVLLGESAVGKSSLVLRFVKGQFLEFQESTIGAAFLTQSVCLTDVTVKFEIWDTAGQERYHSLAPMYYRGAQAAIVVYDLTSYESYERAKTWVKELQRQGSPNIVIALAGNKLDLVTSTTTTSANSASNSPRKVPTQEASSYAEENGILFMETSAKTAANVNELFVAIAKLLPKSQQITGGTTRQSRVALAYESDSTSSSNSSTRAKRADKKQSPCCG